MSNTRSKNGSLTIFLHTGFRTCDLIPIVNTCVSFWQSCPHVVRMLLPVHIERQVLGTFPQDSLNPWLEMQSINYLILLSPGSVNSEVKFAFSSDFPCGTEGNPPLYFISNSCISLLFPSLCWECFLINHACTKAHLKTCTQETHLKTASYTIKSILQKENWYTESLHINSVFHRK